MHTDTAVAPVPKVPKVPFDTKHEKELGGASFTYVHPDGTFVKKQAWGFGHPYVEEHASRFFGTLGLPHIPVRAGEHDDDAFTYAPFVDAPSINRVGTAGLRHLLSHPHKSAGILFGEWLANVGDRHGGNYLIHPSHGALSIDHGATFHPAAAQDLGEAVEEDKTSVHSYDPRHSDLFGIHDTRGTLQGPGSLHWRNTPIDPELTKRALASRDALRQHVADGVSHLEPEHQKEALTAFDGRMGLVKPQMTVGDLLRNHDRLVREIDS